MDKLTVAELEAIEEFTNQLCESSPRSVLVIMWHRAHMLGLKDQELVFKEAIALLEKACTRK